MKVDTIRFNFSVQSSIYENSAEARTRAFVTLLVLSTGWKSGARNRSRTFRTFKAVFAYLNKLNAGGWLSDADYADAWMLVLDVERNYCVHGFSYFRDVFYDVNEAGNQCDDAACSLLPADFKFEE